MKGVNTPLLVLLELGWPFESMHGSEFVTKPLGVNVSRHATSIDAKPLPETVTTVPTGPEEGLSARLRLVTVKVPERESPVRPVTVTV